MGERKKKKRRGQKIFHTVEGDYCISNSADKAKGNLPTYMKDMINRQYVGGSLSDRGKHG